MIIKAAVDLLSDISFSHPELKDVYDSGQIL